MAEGGDPARVESRERVAELSRFWERKERAGAAAQLERIVALREGDWRGRAAEAGEWPPGEQAAFPGQRRAGSDSVFGHEVSEFRRVPPNGSRGLWHASV